MARTSKAARPTAQEISVPLGAEDASYAKRFFRVDDTRCLAVGNRTARWLEGHEPGALLDLGEGYYGSGPYVLPDGRVMLAGLDGLVVLDRTSVTRHRYAFSEARHVLPSGLSGDGLLLTDSQRGLAVWVDFEGRERAVLDAHDSGHIVAGGSVAYVVRSREGALDLERHDGLTKTTATVPWEAVSSDDPFYGNVAITGASACDDGLVVLHNTLQSIVHWRGDAAARIDVGHRVTGARVAPSYTALRTAGATPTVVGLDRAGAPRWSAATERFSLLSRAGGFVLSMEHKGAHVLVVDAHTGAEVFRGALPLSRADDLREGTVRALSDGVVVCAERYRDPQKCAYRLMAGREPVKLAHEGVGGAVTWGDGVATWAHTTGVAAVSLKIWTM